MLVGLSGLMLRLGWVGLWCIDTSWVVDLGEWEDGERERRGRFVL